MKSTSICCINCNYKPHILHISFILYCCSKEFGLKLSSNYTLSLKKWSNTWTLDTMTVRVVLNSEYPNKVPYSVFELSCSRSIHLVSLSITRFNRKHVSTIITMTGTIRCRKKHLWLTEALSLRLIMFGCGHIGH